ncbi:DUF5994 family protein [Streptomyces sp. Tue 6430]|nr:DUF5994 family protein [Streptomyces sp. Tue 6430]
MPRPETTSSREGVLDGAWWPHARHVGTEPPSLIGAWAEFPGPITRVGSHRRPDQEEVRSRQSPSATRHAAEPVGPRAGAHEFLCSPSPSHRGRARRSPRDTPRRCCHRHRCRQRPRGRRSRCCRGLRRPLRARIPLRRSSAVSAR